MNSLITVTKHVRLQTQENLHRISNLASYINNFNTSVIQQFAVLQHYVSRISFQVNFEHLLVSLEQATYLYSRQMDAYYIQRRSLERQQLSEEILPPSELNSIIQTAAKSKFYAVQPMWYYTHVPISPIWSQPDTLIYHATLPFHDRERYLRYSLHSFPLPSAPGIFTQFKLKKDIALHTVSGELLIPKFCVGYNPTICHTGPHFIRKLFPCERAIVTQDETLREKCLVTIMDTPTSSIVQEINPGEYALSTHQLRAHKNCEGKPEEIITIDSGSYLHNKCSLKTLNWTINSITHIKSSRTIPIMPIIVDLATPLKNQLPEISLDTLKSLPKWTPVQDLLKLNVTPEEPLTLMDLTPQEPINILSPTHSWINSSVLISLCVVTTTMIILIKCVLPMCKTPPEMSSQPPAWPTIFQPASQPIQ